MLSHNMARFATMALSFLNGSLYEHGALRSNGSLGIIGTLPKGGSLSRPVANLLQWLAPKALVPSLVLARSRSLVLSDETGSL